MSKKTWGFLFLFFSLGILAVLLLSVFAVKWRSDISQTQGNDLIRLFGEREIGQSFIAGKDNLSRISLDLKNSSLENKKPIYFYLRRKKGEEVLRKIEINGFNIGDPSSVRFEFAPIIDSSGGSYYFYLTSPQSTEEDAIEVYYSPKDLYVDGRMFLGNKELEGDLRFTTFYFSGSKADVAQETIASFFSRFLHDKVFVFFYLFFLVFVFSLGIKFKQDND